MSDGHRDLLERPFVLPGDVLVFPATELGERMRAELDCGDGEFVVTRPGYRSFSRIVDERTAALLEEFRAPARIVEAILRYSRRRDLDPEELLESAFPVLRAFSAALLLVPEDSPHVEGIVASFATGQLVADYEVRRLIQALEDTELYQALGPGGILVAVKIARPAASRETHQMLEREAAVLEHLGGQCSPGLVELGTLHDRPFVVTRWISGVPISTRAHELRSQASANWRRELHELCCRLIAAYRNLHDCGVVHGDVHPRNVLVDSDDSVHLLDFGLSRFVGSRPELDHGRRAGLAWFLEPEAAAPLLRGEPAPPASYAGEQFAVAALAYSLLCGEHHLDAPPDRETLYREVLEGPFQPFARRGFESWPEVESVLARATAKRASERFDSMADFLDAIRQAHPPVQRDQSALEWPAHEMQRLVDEMLERAARAPRSFDDLFPEAPTASVQYGAAGLAWSLYRAAQVREDPSLLAAADHWSRQAVARLDDPGAFHAPAVGITPQRVGPESLHHRASGVHCVHALVSHARGDLRSTAESVERFIEASRQDDMQAELAFGASGVLVGGSLLLDVLQCLPRLDAEPLAEFLVQTADDIWRGLSDLGDGIGDIAQIPHLGIAHGWAGILYAQLRVRRALGISPPEGLGDSLDQLAARAEPLGRGVSWVGTVRHHGQTAETPSHAPGWCSGSAGHVYLWTQAYDAFREQRYLDLAEQAAWYAWEHPDRHPRLCCGLAGRVFALLEIYRETGSPAWLDRAQRLAQHMAAALDSEPIGGPRALSLYWGALGPALVAIELECPERSAMPLFGAEGWPGRA